MSHIRDALFPIARGDSSYTHTHTHTHKTGVERTSKAAYQIAIPPIVTAELINNKWLNRPL